MSDFLEFFKEYFIPAFLFFLMILFLFLAILSIPEYFSISNKQQIINTKYHVNYSKWDYLWNGDTILNTLEISNQKINIEEQK